MWVPVIGNILNIIASLGVVIPQELVAIAGWLAGGSFEVFAKLSQHSPPAPNLIVSPSDSLVTGVCYGSPPLRVRPAYKNLVDDGLSKDRLRNIGTAHGTPDGECGKYYETYRKAGLVSGLMVLWCRHSICVGFHIIPTCEGRNDVFSALYRQWPTAPKVVVYDFACQLAPIVSCEKLNFFKTPGSLWTSSTHPVTQSVARPHHQHMQCNLTRLCKSSIPVQQRSETRARQRYERALAV